MDPVEDWTDSMTLMAACFVWLDFHLKCCHRYISKLIYSYPLFFMCIRARGYIMYKNVGACCNKV